MRAARAGRDQAEAGRLLTSAALLPRIDALGQLTHKESEAEFVDPGPD